MQEYIKEYNFLLDEIIKRKPVFPKDIQLRIDKWITKFEEVCGNSEWEKNRNLNCILLLDCLMNNHFITPFNKAPKESHLPLISKSEVKTKLSNKFIEFIRLNQELILINNKTILNADNCNEISDSPIKSKYQNESLLMKTQCEGDEIEKIKQAISKLKSEIAEKDTILKFQENNINKIQKEIDNNQYIISTIIKKN